MSLNVTFVMYQPFLAGGTRVIAAHARWLRARGHIVRLISQPVLPSWKATASFWLRGKSWSGLKKQSPYLSDLMDVYEVLDSHRAVTTEDVPDADVIVANFWRTAPWVKALPASKGRKVYLVQDAGVLGETMEQIVNTWKMGLRVIVISEWLAEEVRKYAPQEIDVVPNGVDTSVFRCLAPRIKPNQHRIGYVYSSDRIKGSDICTRAVGLVRQRVPELDVVGFGARPPSRQDEIPFRAQFQWNIRDSTTRDIYASCSYWLFGSRRESFGLPILEAMGCGTPVIAASSAAAPEILRNGGGRLVPVNDAEAMAEEIFSGLSQSREDWQLKSNAAVQTAARFDLKASCEKFEAALLRASGV